MITFKIMRYMGATNRITSHAKSYLVLPSRIDHKRSWIFAEYKEGKYPKFSSEALCSEENKNLVVTGEFQSEYHTIVGDGRIELDL